MSLFHWCCVWPGTNLKYPCAATANLIDTTLLSMAKDLSSWQAANEVFSFVLVMLYVYTM